MPTQQEYSELSASDKKQEDWMNSKWRPMMGWMYMFVCVFDFVIAPIGWTSIQALFHGGINTQWQPLTLQGGGLFHVAMGAVIGISAYGRTKEKLEGVAGSNQPMGTQYIPPGMQPGQMGGMNNGMGGMNNGMGGGFGGAPSSGFGGSTGGASAFGAPAAGGFGSSTSGFGSTSTPTGGFGTTATAAPTAGFGTSAGTTTPAVNSSGQKIVPQSSFPSI